MGSSNSQIRPNHIGIIMDGNGRWAKSKGWPRIAGHKEGALTVNNIVTACRKRDIKTLTLYAFSSQNWSRPNLEIKALMALLTEYIKKERKKILDNNIRLKAIGQLNLLPESTQKELNRLIDDSSKNDGMTLCLALSYGGQEEIVDAAIKIAKQIEDKSLTSDKIDKKVFNDNMWSRELGPVDLLIRTSGEERISNFLLWSIAYSEFYFSNKMWPEFNDDDLDDALKEFSSRNRRYGELS